MGAFGGSQPESLAEYCGTSVQMIEQSYGRYIRKDFLGPLIAARPQGPSEAAVEGKTGPLTGPPQWSHEQKARISSRTLVEAGAIASRSKCQNFFDLSHTPIFSYPQIYPLENVLKLSLRVGWL